MKHKLLILLVILSFETLNAQNKTANDYINEVNISLEKREITNAFQLLDQAITEMPDSGKLYDMRGAIHDAMGMYDKAITDFSEAINLTEEDSIKARLLSNRGGTKCKIRDFESAYEDLTTSMKYDSSNVNVLNNLSVICKELNKPEEAIMFLERAISINPNYATGYVNLGFTYQEFGEYEKSVLILDKAIALKPDKPLAYSNRSFAKLKLGDIEGAFSDIEKSIHLLPTNSYAYKIRALIEIEKGNNDKACKDLNQALYLGYTKQYGTEVKDLLEAHCK